VSGLQRFFLAILPRSLAKAMEKESRLWMMVCPDCGRETSIWDAGGIRYLAAGNPRRRFSCPKCGLRWHTVVKKVAPIVAQAIKP
jgi:predicted RNA-binding Zn-ribbon protein involved in translation (DUF1610 family)